MADTGMPGGRTAGGNSARRRARPWSARWPRRPAAGAFVSVNHPKPFGPAWEYPEVRAFHAVEVWNGLWPRLNSQALAFWEARLRAGMHLVAVGGSDTHNLRTADPDPRHSAGLGTPTTWVQVGRDPDAAAILGALRAGRTFVSSSPSGPQLYLEPGGAGVSVAVRGAAGLTLVVLGDAGAIGAAAVPAGLAGEEEWSFTVRVPRGTAYIRAQLVVENGDLAALTSPLWWPAAD